MAPVKTDYQPPDEKTIQELKDCANRLRILSIKCTSAAKSGHPTSASSAADIVATLFFHAMRMDVVNPRDPNSDRFVMSKGHAAPLLYAAWAETGHISEEEVMRLRKIDSDIEGHPTPRLDFVDVATGSLGQGLSCAAGMAYGAKYIDKASYRVYCLLGDGESTEGSVWEAAHFASLYKLDNLIGIFDINRLGQSAETSLGHNLETYERRLDSFGWLVLRVDGHDIPALCGALFTAQNARGGGKPIAIVAKTFKGRGFPEIEDKLDWHGKPLGEKADGVLAVLEAQLVNKSKIKLCVACPTKDVPVIDRDFSSLKLAQPPQYSLGEKVATRLAYGTGLAKLAADCDRVVALDGDVSNSTFSDKLRKQFPDRFVECYIAEQNMVGVGVGLATRGRTIPFCSTFAAFYTRAADQLRMGAISMTNLKCCGSHVGVSIGEDGPSQMGLEDLGLFCALPGSVVFYPSEAVSCERAVELAGRHQGLCYIRTSRPATPVLYANDEPFAIGKAKILRQSPEDKVVIVGAGVTLFEALKAADALKAAGTSVCVLDPFTVKPLDVETLVEQVCRVGGKVVVVEDHYAHGGLGSAVAVALGAAGCLRAARFLAVESLPRSGPSDVLLDMFGISAKHVEAAVKQIL